MAGLRTGDNYLPLGHSIGDAHLSLENEYFYIVSTISPTLILNGPRYIDGLKIPSCSIVSKANNTDSIGNSH